MLSRSGWQPWMPNSASEGRGLSKHMEQKLDTQGDTSGMQERGQVGPEWPLSCWS